MYVEKLSKLRMSDLDQVGGKNASLGEMIGALSGAGIRVPGGFATTAAAFQLFLSASGLDKRISERLKTLDPANIESLTRGGAEIRGWIGAAPFPKVLEDAIRAHYAELAAEAGEGSFPRVDASHRRQEKHVAPQVAKKRARVVRGLDLLP